MKIYQRDEIYLDIYVMREYSPVFDTFHPAGYVLHDFCRTLPDVLHRTGDGNMHVTLYLEREEREWREIIEAARRRLYAVVIKFGGTLTGEHGVGLKRVEYVPLFIDRAQIELIRRVKLAFDPNNILNPGKMVPWE